MMDLAKLNENHKLLAGTTGTWGYTVKMWMDPNGKPTESTGTATRKSVMDGRYVFKAPSKPSPAAHAVWDRELDT